MKLPSYIYIYFSFFLLSCSSGEMSENLSEGNDRVIFGASKNGVLQSRHTRSREMIVDQWYNLTFSNLEVYELGRIDFNSEGLGYASHKSEGKEIDLLWRNVGTDEPNGDTYSFYLDNIPEFYMRETMVYLPDDNIYSLAEYIPEDKADPDKGIYSNELFWGAVKNVKRMAVEEVDIYPVMARFALKVYFDNSAVGQDKSPESASLTNLFHSAVSFDRLTGTFSFRRPYDTDDPLPVAEPFMLVDNYGQWKKYYDEEAGMYFYLSPEYILPPQEFISNMRPRLTITLTNGTVYSGLFPQIMSLIGDDGISTPWTMSFIKGYKLTLNVKISNDAASMQFMPASLIDWWDKGERNFSGKQASVGEDKEFAELIDAYTGNSFEELYRWGYEESEGHYVFNIFRNFDINADAYKGVMPENSQLTYEFNLHYATITINLPDGKHAYLYGIEGAKKLKDLLNGGIYPQADPEPEAS